MDLSWGLGVSRALLEENRVLRERVDILQAELAKLRETLKELSAKYGVEGKG